MKPLNTGFVAEWLIAAGITTLILGCLSLFVEEATTVERIVPIVIMFCVLALVHKIFRMDGEIT